MYEDIRYQKSFLKQVIVRIDFFSPVDAIEKALSPKLANTAAKSFPIAEPGEILVQHLEIAKTGVQESKTPFKQWNFFGRNRERQLTLSAPFMFVTFSEYSTYEVMKDIWSELVDSVAKIHPDAKVGRFGLRYINSIEIEGVSPTEWGTYVEPHLLITGRPQQELDHLTRSLHLSEFKYDELNLRFQFGMPNPDYPAIIKRPLFIMDFDAYVNSAHEMAESLKYMDKGHELIQDVFEKSIKNQLRERMNAAIVPVQ
jgi:uncharacterized protein (TIGR04255 family)